MNQRSCCLCYGEPEWGANAMQKSVNVSACSKTEEFR